MNKRVLLGIIVSTFCINYCIAQSNQYPVSGDVIIQSYSPTLVLQRNTNVGGYTSGIQTKTVNGDNSWYFGNLMDYSWILAKGDWQNPLLTVLSDGKVGVGTDAPSEKLHILGNIKFAVNQSANEAGYYGFLQSFHASNTGVLTFAGAGGAGKVIGAENYGTDTVIYSDATEKIRILSNGNIGIGKTNPFNKLDVNGTIHSQEVKVDMDGWSDFVFKKDYALPTLEEVEKHIAENGHLENIPSEKEVLEKGINLGEMNSKLLQKIEEMTLYIIEQNKKIIDLEMRLGKVETNFK